MSDLQRGIGRWPSWVFAYVSGTNRVHATKSRAPTGTNSQPSRGSVTQVTIAPAEPS
jgi:hypothetical protein